MSTTAPKIVSEQASPTVSGRRNEIPKSRRIPWPTSTLGQKYIVAITGLGLTLFVIGHMVGNLQVFLGRQVLNHYAHFLKSNPEILWPVRIGLLLFFVIHMIVAINLQLKNRSARSIGYAYPRKFSEATLASRTMVWTGLLILVFLLYHLAHFTFGWTDPSHFNLRDVHDPLGHQVDVYAMVIYGFRQPVVVALYVIAQVFLGLHLAHAVPSMFQTLGINRPRWQLGLERVGLVIAWGVVIANILMPTLILLDSFLPGSFPIHFLPEAPQNIPG
jgi:succinate dehydrogenase / fumarate reductase cytochrome b subunit